MRRPELNKQLNKINRPNEPQRAASAVALHPTVIETIVRAQRWPAALNKWERGFLVEIIDCSQLSGKQRVKLDQILQKVASYARQHSPRRQFE